MSGTPAPAGHSSPKRLSRPCRKGPSLTLGNARPAGSRDRRPRGTAGQRLAARQADRRKGRPASVSRGDMLPAAFAHLPRTGPQERSVAFCPVCSRARRPDAGRASLFQGPANAAGGNGGRTRPMVSHAAAPLGRLFYAPANQGQWLENRDKTGISLQALGRDFGKK